MNITYSVNSHTAGQIQTYGNKVTKNLQLLITAIKKPSAPWVRMEGDAILFKNCDLIDTGISADVFLTAWSLAPKITFTIRTKDTVLGIYTLDLTKGEIIQTMSAEASEKFSETSLMLHPLDIAELLARLCDLLEN